MTIYAAKAAAKKKEEAPGACVECGTSENRVNKGKEGLAADGTVLSRSHALNLFNLHGKRLVLFCIIVVLLVIIISGSFLGLVVYRKALNKMFHGWSDVRYYEYNKESEISTDTFRSSGNRFYQHHYGGTFRQEIELDFDNGLFERIEVPRIGNSWKATVIHDFMKNVTAIADHDHSRCFILPLNRRTALPPRDLFDMLSRRQIGPNSFYMPDAEIVRENYRAITPPVQEMTVFGPNVWKECSTCNTYLLTKRVTLIMNHQNYGSLVKKRSACALSGAEYCLGDAGTDQVLCIQIKDCV